MKKFLIFICILLLAIPFIYAWEFDNVGDYDLNSKTYTITNSFGLGSDIATIKLNTPQNNVVGLGYQMVAEITIDNKGENYEEIIKGIELYKINEGMKPFGRDVDYKYWDGKGWVNFNKNSLDKEETITLGLFTTVEFGDNVEWILDMYGERLVEWATWSTTLNEDLLAYWSCDAGSGTVLGDDTGNENNGTIVSSMWNNTHCILGDCLGPFASGKNITLDSTPSNFNFTHTDSFSISLWFNATVWTGTNQFLVQKSIGNTGGDTGWVIYLDESTDDRIYWWLTTTSGTNSIVVHTNASKSLDEGNLYHLVVVYNGSATASEVLFYINGTKYDTVVDSDTLSSAPAYITPEEFVFGSKVSGTEPYSGYMDEIAIWNRTISSSEVTDLWNEGVGISYLGSPEVTLNSPADATTQLSQTIEFNCSATDTVEIANISLFIDGVVNYTRDGDGSGFRELNKTLSLSVGSHTWSCNATDSDSEVSGGEERTLGIGYAINSETYNATTYEMRSEGYILNLSYSSDITSVSGSLILNGTSYLVSKSGDSTETIMTNTIDIPSFTGTSAQDYNFYWNLFFTTGSGTTEYNTTTRTQTVSPVVFVRCNSTYSTPIVVNYTIYNESSRDLINATMDASFVYWLGDGDITKSYFLDSTDSNSTFQFCTNSNETFSVDAIINLEASGYNERTYYFNNQQYNNATTEQFLYMISTGNGTNVIIQVRDAGLVPLQGYYVTIERYYPEIHAYKEVIIGETDEYGQFVAKLIENTVKYKFTFRDGDGVVKKTTEDMTIACRSSICVLPFVIEDTTDDFDRFDNVTDYDWSFSFDNDTNIFTFTWNDVSGSSAINWLKVERYLFNGTTLVCNSTSTSLSGSLTCDVGDQEASYQAQAFRKVGGESWNRIGLLSKKVGITFQTYGKEGLIWSFFLFMTAIAIGYWFPPAGMVFFVMISVPLYFANILYVNPAILIAEWLVVILFCWAFGGKK